MYDSDAIVIDCGSDSTKAGFANDDQPRDCFPSVIGRNRNVEPSFLKDHYCAYEAYAKRGILSLKYPVHRGEIVSFDDLALLWEYTFTDALRVDPNEQPLALSHFVLINDAHRTKMAEIAFERFGVPALHLASQEQLALQISPISTDTGLVCSVGERGYVVPIVQGRVVQSAVRVLDLGGYDLTRFMLKLMQDRGFSFLGSVSSENEFCQPYKEKVCYVAQNYEDELKLDRFSPPLMQYYETSDGNAITTGAERFICPEALFKPSLVNQPFPGLLDLVISSVISFDQPEMRRDLLRNIVLTGGSAMFPGLDTRIQVDLCSRFAPDGFNTVAVNSPPAVDRIYGAWLGAAQLARRNDFASAICTSATQFAETGRMSSWTT